MAHQTERLVINWVAYYQIEWWFTKLNGSHANGMATYQIEWISYKVNGSHLDGPPRIEFWTTLREPGIDWSPLGSSLTYWGHLRYLEHQDHNRGSTPAGLNLFQILVFLGAHLSVLVYYNQMNKEDFRRLQGGTDNHKQIVQVWIGSCKNKNVTADLFQPIYCTLKQFMRQVGL